MSNGYMGKILSVDLNTGKMEEEEPSEIFYRELLGGYGVGSRIVYSRQRGGVDALGPENILAIATGILTGTPATTGCRYQAMAKSPLTGGWGDANSGGDFGPYLKFAGYDAVFFSGIADKPVYLLVNNGRAELRDAGHLWGKDTYETEDILKEELGKDAEVVCIGQSGEKLSFISCIITQRGAAAGRSGLGAVMGSKKLKAVATKGDSKVGIADLETVRRINKEYVKDLKNLDYRGLSFFDHRRKYGSSNHTVEGSHSGDTPVKNWGGVGVVDFPNPSGLSGDLAIANLDRRGGCWHCVIGCEGRLKEGQGEYKYPAGTRRPEYETQASFGTMCLNSNGESIAMVNHLCNSYGLDTISGGTVIAFAIECYENGIITREDTDGIELTWGNHHSIVAMTEKIVKREGFGDILADGVKVAAEKIGKGADEYAVHIGGQELGMHDPKLVFPGRDTPAAARYQMDATPGRHTQGFGPSGFIRHVINATGLCLSIYSRSPSFPEYIERFMRAVTGWDYSMEELQKAGERIANIRHVFNLREGINPLELKIHPRIIGAPPQMEGPLAGIRADAEAQNYWNLGALDWDRKTTKPSKKKLLELHLDDIATELWP